MTMIAIKVLKIFMFPVVYIKQRWLLSFSPRQTIYSIVHIVSDLA